MFERYGRTFAPAGMIWSVVMLSPTLMTTSFSIAGASGVFSGSGRMFGPCTTSTLSGCSRSGA